jgi:molybdopterin-guanine dinucleotide biosynthesis protein A
MSMHPAIILAGGRSSRMGGGHKSLLKVDGHSMIDHVIRRAASQCAPLALNVNGDPADFSGLGLPVLRDSMPDFPGPLAGVLVGLEWAASLGGDRVISIAADTPFFPLDLAERLAALASGTAPVIAATRLADGEIIEHPTFALWPVALRDPLREAMEAGERRVRGFAKAHGVKRAIWETPDHDPFFNVNTPEDLAQAQLLASYI